MMPFSDNKPSSKERAEDALFREFLYKGVGMGWTLEKTVEHLKDTASARGILFTGNRKTIRFHGDHPNVVTALEELMGALADNMFGPDTSCDTKGESSKKTKTNEKGKERAK
jgi:hypothetical protein